MDEPARDPCACDFGNAKTRYNCLSPPHLDLFRAFGAASFLPTLPYARPPCRPGGLLRGEDGMLLFPVGEFSLFLTARKDRIRENIVSDKKKIRFFLVDYFFIFG